MISLTTLPLTWGIYNTYICTMKYILLLLLFWAANMSAQTPNTFHTDYMVISNMMCDSIDYETETLNIITIVNTLMTITSYGGVTQVYRVYLMGQDEDGTYSYEYGEYGKGYIDINPLVPYVTIWTEYGCIDYFNQE